MSPRQSLPHLSTGVPLLDAQADFREARRAYALARIGRWLIRQRAGRQLSTLPDTTATAGGPAHLEIVPLARIMGTVEPTTQFDASFRPASEVVRDRWERVALAHREGVSLPPIALVERADGYYVVDGHHRVSVARALGHTDIDAWVVGARQTARGPADVSARTIGSGHPAATPSSELSAAMIAPPTVTDTNERAKLVSKKIALMAASMRSSSVTTTIAATIAAS